MVKIYIVLQKLNKNVYLTVNLTMDSSRVLYADYYAISRFFTTGQSFEILLFKTTKNAILTYFLVFPFDIKQQYLKSKYFVGVIENSFLFDFQSFSFLVITRVLIELKTCGNLKIKEETVFYYVNEIF